VQTRRPGRRPCLAPRVVCVPAASRAVGVPGPRCVGRVPAASRAR